MSKPTFDELCNAIYRTRLRLDGKCVFCLEHLAADEEFRKWHLKEKHDIDPEIYDTPPNSLREEES